MIYYVLFLTSTLGSFKICFFRCSECRHGLNLWQGCFVPYLQMWLGNRISTSHGIGQFDPFWCMKLLKVWLPQVKARTWKLRQFSSGFCDVFFRVKLLTSLEQSAFCHDIQYIQSKTSVAPQVSTSENERAPCFFGSSLQLNFHDQVLFLMRPSTLLEHQLSDKGHQKERIRCWENLGHRKKMCLIFTWFLMMRDQFVRISIDFYRFLISGSSSMILYNFSVTILSVGSFASNKRAGCLGSFWIPARRSLLDWPLQYSGGLHQHFGGFVAKWT